MSLYERYCFPYILDMAMHREPLHAPRRRLLQHVSGKILELGFGTGANLPHYPARVKTITVVEPSPILQRRVSRRLATRGMQVQWETARGETLPFAATMFDTVVCTFTLCSVQDPTSVLAEIRRVLMPDGRLLLLEHGRSNDAAIIKWQNRLNGLNRRLACGCHLNRDIKAILAGNCFTFTQVQQYELEKTPRIGGFMTEGIAIPGTLEPTQEAFF